MQQFRLELGWGWVGLSRGLKFLPLKGEGVRIHEGGALGEI